MFSKESAEFRDFFYPKFPLMFCGIFLIFVKHNFGKNNKKTSSARL